MLARLVLLSTLFTSGPRAGVIDRVAVTLDSQIITESEIAQEIRLAAFLNDDPPEFSPESRKKAADRLIEQKLIRREMQLGRYLGPNKDDVETMLKQVQAQRFQSPEAYRGALEKYDLTEGDLKDYLLWQLTLLRFIDTRFRPGVQVTDDEIRATFESQLAKLENTADPGKSLKLEDRRDQIRETLINQRVDQQLDEWLDATRKRTRIQFHPEAFQ
ncbi:MAG: hypothetical protein LAP39_19865 [Acidobacteriia bacterium]|nr:hypothetical protein [Terriglobia bacterium]